MLNYRVADLDRLLEAPRREDVTIDPKREGYDHGRFAWITDPEGNRIELWEPPQKRAKSRKKNSRKSAVRSQRTNRKREKRKNR